MGAMISSAVPSGILVTATGRGSWEGPALGATTRPSGEAVS